MAEIQKTYHVDVRMNQRGITEEMLGLTLEYGDIQGDKFVTNRKNLKLNRTGFVGESIF
ncbi:hypothetical protein ABEF89_00550 [Acinetobacter thermotolerans]|uniref:hypothetical protein n=1 Tax=Acinetobacter thermotolerans TaxID=3151487 RepID=UPI00325B4EEF